MEPLNSNIKFLQKSKLTMRYICMLHAIKDENVVKIHTCAHTHTRHHNSDNKGNSVHFIEKFDVSAGPTEAERCERSTKHKIQSLTQCICYFH